MKRFKELFVLLVIAVAVALLAAIPASAGQGGTPTDGACGIGKSLAQDAVADQAAGPGASEVATVPPNLCKGH
jgi:hypothetical protein